MTRARAPRKPAAAGSPESPGAPAVRGTTLEAAMRPQRRLLVVLGIVLAVWVGLLLSLYFTTVYPLRHQSPGAPAASGAAR